MVLVVVGWCWWWLVIGPTLAKALGPVRAEVRDWGKGERETDESKGEKKN